MIWKDLKLQYKEKIQRLRILKQEIVMNNKIKRKMMMRPIYSLILLELLPGLMC